MATKKTDQSAIIDEGIIAARKGEYLRALTLLTEAYPGKVDKKHIEGLSFYGLCVALVQKRITPAVELCRQAIELQFQNIDHYANLARVYIAGGMRKEALDTIEEGLRIHAGDEVLLLIRKEMGVRAQPAVPFLSRTNPINKAIGQRRHARKKGTPSTVLPLDEESE